MCRRSFARTPKITAWRINKGIVGEIVVGIIKGISGEIKERIPKGIPK